MNFISLSNKAEMVLRLPCSYFKVQLRFHRGKTKRVRDHRQNLHHLTTGVDYETQNVPYLIYHSSIPLA